MNKILFCTDEHHPFQNQQLIDKMFRFVKVFKPDTVIFGGDTCDFYNVSRFSKAADRAFNLQDELSMTIKYFDRFRKALPKAKMVLLESNHHDRLKKYLESHESLAQLLCLDPVNLLQLERNNIQLLDNYEIGDCIFIHGEKLGGKSGATADKNMAQYRSSGVNGHSHRANKYYSSFYKATNFWIEAPCLCQKLDYMGRDPVNWSYGFVWGYEIGGKVQLNTWTTAEPLIINGVEIK